MSKKKVLFVCIHNSARSQMAEELLRKIAGDRFEVASAGIEPPSRLPAGRDPLNPVVVEVLKKEEGINIEGKKTTGVNDLLKLNKAYDYVITVCDETGAERCPLFPGKSERLHWGFADPSKFLGNFEEKFKQTAAVKEQIKKKIMDWINGFD